MMPKISVIIPVYNTEKYILRCLNSIIDQGFHDYEIIIVDDGSTDNSKTIIENVISNCKNISINYIYQENAGQAAARNLAISKAKGEYVCFIDSDDYIDEGMFEALYNEAENTSSDIVVCDMKFAYEDGTYKYLKNFSALADTNIKNYILSNAGPCGKIIKTDIIKNNNLYFPKGIIYEDLAVVPAYGIYANKISYIPKAYYNYFQRTNSTMNQIAYNPKFENIFVAMENLKNIFIATYAYNNYLNEIEYLYVEHLLHAACIRFLNFKEGEENISKIVEIMKTDWPRYTKNAYFKKCSLKYKIVCNLFYKKQLALLKKIFKK